MIAGTSFLEIEQQLRAIPGEAAARTRIGRLYYGVYLEYRTFCEEFLSFDRRKLLREHQVVRDLIGPIDPRAAQLLHSLRIARNQADYDLDIDAMDIDVLLAESITAANLAMAGLRILRSNYEQR